jgi:4-amino-4-deoxy-L-arabinose transferase-like glycosyltransferase
MSTGSATSAEVVATPPQSAPQPAARASSRRWLAVVTCGALAVVSYVLAAFAVLSKSPTCDEPYHFAAAYTHVFGHDYRIDPEDPPLWSWLAMLPIAQRDLDAATQSPEALALWDKSLENPMLPWTWVDQVMFPPGGGDATSLINRSRMMMALLAPAIVALAAALAWRLAGPIAAIAAAALLAFDPLLLGHAPLLKNDAAITLATLATAAALMATMRRASAARLLVLAACCALAVVVKFSGILIVMLAIGALLVRALLPQPWPMLRREVRSRLSRFGAAGAMSITILATCWLAIWAAYGFRFAATASGNQLAERWFVYQVQGRSFVARHQRSPSEQELETAPIGHVVPVVLWINHHRLLPNAYSMGFDFMHASSQSRNAYLLGKVRNTGWWDYFPLAMLFKTPTAGILAVVIAAMVGLVMRARLKLPREAIVCLIALGGGYLLVAMSSHLNLGVRHVMPVYPLIYIAVGVVGAQLASAKPQAAGWIGAVLAVALAAETISAYPNYIAFFNAPSGGTRGGLRLLGDSNLDWGQDLPLLADWQTRHPTVKLYLSYFGAVDPEVYGIDYVNIGGGGQNPGRRPVGRFSEPGVFAVSATQLQGIYLAPGAGASYTALRNLPPREVLGGTIYLYDYPFRKTP